MSPQYPAAPTVPVISTATSAFVPTTTTPLVFQDTHHRLSIGAGSGLGLIPRRALRVTRRCVPSRFRTYVAAKLTPSSDSSRSSSSSADKGLRESYPPDEEWLSRRRETIIGGPYAGQFGPWYLRQGDVDDVWAYRILLFLTALQVAAIPVVTHLLTSGGGMSSADGLIVLGGAEAGSTTSATTGLSSSIYDLLVLGASMTFGLSLRYIHIYLRPLHTALKVCWASGMVGAAVCVLTLHSVAGAAVTHPMSLLASGWVLVALTGVFVKEAFCFRRGPALLLALLTPALAAGHFLHVLVADVDGAGSGMSQHAVQMSPQQTTADYVGTADGAGAAAVDGAGMGIGSGSGGVGVGGSIEQTMVTLFAAVFLVFALQKFTQNPMDDIGDMSVFTFLAQQEREEELRRQQQQQQ